ncbi:unnamed protein product [Mytilus edulis]|uniref:G-protein coupled receptors family 1 profile domain-containing protein n=1 Tax=Mytilus edulis TaxID=6550 RepID=A0A8S3V8C7_MYTED|nr:unnamed protein product [Mytilus edulis]
MQINISSSGIVNTLLTTVNTTRFNTSNERSTDEDLSESTQQVVGTVICVLSVLGVAANITVLKMVLTNRHQLNSSTVFIPALAVIGFIVSAFFLPLHAAAAFRKSLTFDQSECMFYKFVFNLTGLLFSTLLTVMVVQTYRLIVSVHSAKAGFDKGCVVLVLAGCILVCVIVAALPFVGMADYAPYRRPILCHIRWIPFEYANIAYFTSLAIVFFVLPTILISTLYAFIYFKTKKSSLNSLSSTRGKHRHIFMLKTFLVITVAYILTWSPFVVCIALDLSGIDYHSYSHFIYLVCTMVAKVSLTWIPVIFVIRHSHYKKELDSLTHNVIEKVGQLTMSSAEYNLDSTDRAVEGELAVEMYLIPSKPVLISYRTSDDAL